MVLCGEQNYMEENNFSYQDETETVLPFWVSMYSIINQKCISISRPCNKKVSNRGCFNSFNYNSFLMKTKGENLLLSKETIT